MCISLVRVIPNEILPSSILCGVWYTKRGSVAGRILRNGRAIDCNMVGVAGGGRAIKGG